MAFRKLNDILDSSIHYARDFWAELMVLALASGIAAYGVNSSRDSQEHIDMLNQDYKAIISDYREQAPETQTIGDGFVLIDSAIKELTEKETIVSGDCVWNMVKEAGNSGREEVSKVNNYLQSKGFSKIPNPEISDADILYATKEASETNNLVNPDLIYPEVESALRQRNYDQPGKLDISAINKTRLEGLRTVREELLTSIDPLNSYEIYVDNLEQDYQSNIERLERKRSRLGLLTNGLIATSAVFGGLGLAGLLNQKEEEINDLPPEPNKTLYDESLEAKVKGSIAEHRIQETSAPQDYSTFGEYYQSIHKDLSAYNTAQVKGKAERLDFFVDSFVRDDGLNVTISDAADIMNLSESTMRRYLKDYNLATGTSHKFLPEYKNNIVHLEAEELKLAA